MLTLPPRFSLSIFLAPRQINEKVLEIISVLFHNSQSGYEGWEARLGLFLLLLLDPSAAAAALGRVALIAAAAAAVRPDLAVLDRVRERQTLAGA